MISPALVLFVLSAAFIVYVIAGYPLILGILARRSPKRTHKQRLRKSVSVVVAVRNGAPWIRRKLQSILNLEYPRELMEVIVVSDGSNDGTDEIVREFSSEGVQLIHVPQGGKPAALNAGIPLTKNEILVLTDVRQELEPGSLQHMIDCFTDPKIGVVSGELMIRKGDTLAEQNVGAYWTYETWIRKRLTEVDSMLGATGPFYAIRRELAVPMPPDTLLDDMYLPLAAFFRGYRLITEEQARAIDYPTGLQTEFKRKVRTLAGNYQIMKQYPALLGPGNRMWFHFVSYKLGRLLLPYALITAAIATFWLPPVPRMAALLLQGLSYGLALLDGWIPEGTLLKRLTSPPRTFVMLMAAAVCAVSIFFVPPQTLWKPTRTRAAGGPD